MHKTRLLASIAVAALLVASPVSLMGGSGHFAGPSAAQAQGANINISFFFGELAPHGTWVRHQRHRYVWVPNAIEADWAPYTNGHWVYTDRHGWLFVSDDPYGWATYHYGRWAREPGLGWYWVPGTVWAPAWVSWRRGPDYVGWAPLPPEDDGYAVSIRVNVRDVPEDRWFFVPTVRFLEPNLRVVLVREADRPAIFQRTEYLGPVIVQNNTVINNVIEVNYIEQQTNQTVVVNQIQTVESPQQAQAAEGSVAVFAPQVAEAEEDAAPPQVVEAEQVIQQREQGGTAATAEQGSPPAAGATTAAPAGGADAAATAPAAGANTTTAPPAGADATTTAPAAGADTTTTAPAADAQGTTTDAPAEPTATTTEPAPLPAAQERTAGESTEPAAGTEEAAPTTETAPVTEGAATEGAAEPGPTDAGATEEPAAEADAAPDEAPAGTEEPAPAPCTPEQRAAGTC